MNGVRAGLGEKVAPGIDRVTVDGREVSAPEALVYVLLNKPVGYLSTCSDPFRRRTVLQLLEGVKERVFPVGRLDLDAEGLLLLTNDGDLAYLLTHPKHHVVKEYIVDATGKKDITKTARLTSGVVVDGKEVAADYARFLPVNGGDADGLAVTRPERVRLCIGIHEGEKHVVKKMCSYVGYMVRGLRRTRVGPLSLGDLKTGRWRYLSPREVKELQHAAGESTGVAGRSHTDPGRSVERAGRPKYDAVDAHGDGYERDQSDRVRKHAEKRPVQTGTRERDGLRRSPRSKIEK